VNWDPENNYKQQGSFRLRVVEMLLATAAVRAVVKDDQIDDLAKRYGVDPETLIEARIQYRTHRKKQGLQMPMGQKRTGTRHYQLKCSMPEPIFKAWKSECEFRGIESSAVMRSLIHGYLLGSYEPTNVVRGWRWRGKRYTCQEWTYERKGKRGGWPYRERSLITMGAKRALFLRAEARGTTVISITRALVLEFIDGKHQSLRVIDAQTMYDDVSRYRTTPGPRPDEALK
jgi:hypothetical protein